MHNYSTPLGSLMNDVLFYCLRFFSITELEDHFIVINFTIIILNADFLS